MIATHNQDPAAGHESELPRKTGAETRELAFLAAREAPLNSRALFWQPRYMAESATLMHLPFLFWLVETMRPRIVAQIGMREGVGFLALCQAVDKLGLDTVCLGLDRPKDGRPGCPDTHASLYADFSFILPYGFGQEDDLVQEGELDLLVIDSPLDEALLDALHSRWLPLLSSHAILVLHDPERNLPDPAARSFHDQLLKKHPAIRFPQSGIGMDAFLIGAQQPERLGALARCTPGTPGYLAARQVFGRLGQGLQATESNRRTTAALDQARAALEDAQDQLNTLRRAHDRLQTQATTAQAAEEAHLAENAVLQARVFDLTRATDAIRANTARLDTMETEHAAAIASRDRMIADLTRTDETRARKLAETETRLETMTRDLASMTQEAEKCSALEAALDAREQDAKRRITELKERLGQALSQRDDAREKLVKKREEASTRVRELKEQLAIVRKERDKLAEENRQRQQELETLRNSTSWRVTAPIRSVKSLVAPSDPRD